MKQEVIVDQPVIPAEGFILRPLAISDRGMLEFNAGDKRVAHMTRSIPHPLPPGAVEAFIARSHATDRQEDIWVLDASSFGSSEVMGVVSLRHMGREQGEIRGWIAPAFWKTGLSSRVIEALLAANPNDNDTIFAEVFQDNDVMARVLSANGFTYLGDAEAFSVSRNATVPTWTYIKRLK